MFDFKNFSAGHYFLLCWIQQWSAVLAVAELLFVVKSVSNDVSVSAPFSRTVEGACWQSCIIATVFGNGMWLMQIWPAKVISTTVSVQFRAMRIVFSTNSGLNSVLVFSHIVTAYRIWIVVHRLWPTTSVPIAAVAVAVSITTVVHVFDSNIHNTHLYDENEILLLLLQLYYEAKQHRLDLYSIRIRPYN